MLNKDNETRRVLEGYCNTPGDDFSKERFELLAELDWSDGCYQFDLTGIFRYKEDNTLYAAFDSGCSCPSPWEYFTEGDLIPIERLRDLDEACKEKLSDLELDKTYYAYGTQVEAWYRFRENVASLLADLKEG